MANNIDVKDGAGVSKTTKTTDNAGVHTPHVNVDTLVPGTGATNLGKAEDDAHSSGDVGVMALSVYKATPVATAGAAGDYQPLITGPNGRLWVSAGGGISIPASLTVTNGAYTAGDVVGGLITFANAARINGGASIINSVKISSAVAINYELWLLNADLATPIADNGAWNMVVGDTTKCLGQIQLISWLAAGANFSICTSPGLGLQVQAAAGTTSIYGYLVTRVTTSPGSTRIDITLDAEYID